jgi:hypothetical protein
MTLDPQNPIPHGGTRPKPPEELRSPVLRRLGAEAAAASFARIEQAWPELMERYGERGRRLTAEDNLWHLNFLDAAMSLGDPSLFDRYADWLVAFLVARGLVPRHVSGAFGFLADALESAEVPEAERPHRSDLVEVLRTAAARIEYAPGS